MGGAVAWIAGGWQVSGVTLLKSGTPFTRYVGSDGPGFGTVGGGSFGRVLQMGLRLVL